MFKLLFSAAAVALVLIGCTPPEPVPPPRFKPNPPYPPQPVDPYGQPTDPYGQSPDNPGITDPPPELPQPKPGDYPTATPSGRPNEVISPYEPREPIDVSGYSSGQLVRDPRNRKIFRVP